MNEKNRTHLLRPCAATALRDELSLNNSRQNTTVVPRTSRRTRPETPVQLRSGFDEILKAVEPLAGSRDPETLTEVFWSSLHGLASLARAGRLRPDLHEKRMAILVEHA